VARSRTDDDKLTVSEPLSVILGDGTTAYGTLWMHWSQSGRFEVEYKGMRKSDHRTDYISAGPMRSIGRMILKELFQAEQQRIAREKRGG
jgi:hypothetical protein